MAPIKCKLIVQPRNGGYVQQLLTGFIRLHNRCIIDLTESVVQDSAIDHSKAQHLRDARLTHLSVIVNGSIKLYYDTHDSWEVDEENLDNADYYFKRSFVPARLETLNLGEHRAKIFPLGLNYVVYPSHWDVVAARRSIKIENDLTAQDELLQALGLSLSREWVPRITQMYALPDYGASPRILFMTRVWDPFDHPDRSREKIAERMQINEMRVNCIRQLRTEFQDKFVGGLVHSDFAVRHYNQFLISDKELGWQKNYLRLLNAFPICVTTTGLHGSIGWKFAEYVAFSKAIVSERLNYQVTGNLEAGNNYLEFLTAEQCVERVHQVVQDHQLMAHLMTNNKTYYSSYLYPNALVLRTIETALGVTVE